MYVVDLIVWESHDMEATLVLISAMSRLNWICCAVYKCVLLSRRLAETLLSDLNWFNGCQELDWRPLIHAKADTARITGVLIYRGHWRISLYLNNVKNDGITIVYHTTSNVANVCFIYRVYRGDNGSWLYNMFGIFFIAYSKVVIRQII